MPLATSLLLALLGYAPSPVEVYGNAALTEEVYLSVLGLMASSSTIAPHSLAEERRVVEARVTDFLVHSGYELATVSSTVVDARILLLVDEGKLDRVIFVGEGALSTVELKNALALPGEVFNRPLVQRRLDELTRARTGVTGVSFEVVELPEVEHRGPQLVDVALLQNLQLQKVRARYELRVTFSYAGWVTGFDLGFGYRPPDGLFVRGGYRAANAFFDPDRFELEGELALRIADAISGVGNRLGLSRVGGAATYFTPPLVGDFLRPFARVSAELLGRKRIDVGLESYLYAPLFASLDLELAIDPVKITGGWGYERRYLLSTFPLEGASVTVPTDGQNHGRFFLEGKVDVRFNPEEIRRDRAHYASVFARWHGVGSNDSQPFVRLTAEYQHMIPFGWDELWLGGKAGLLFGDVPFYEEMALGDGFLRAAFQEAFFVRRGAGAKIEYRLSLSRDLVKVSVFDDLVVFEALDALRQHDARRIASSTGLGLHLLLYEAFQANMYLGFGITNAGDFDVGVGLAVTQAF